MPCIVGVDDGPGFGVKGTSATGTGLAGEGAAWAGVSASSVTGSGVSTFSDSGAGVLSVSSRGRGVSAQRVEHVVVAVSDGSDAVRAFGRGAGVGAERSSDNGVVGTTPRAYRPGVPLVDRTVVAGRLLPV